MTTHKRVPFEHLCPEVRAKLFDLKTVLAQHEPGWMHAQITFDNIHSELDGFTVDVLSE